VTSNTETDKFIFYKFSLLFPCEVSQNTIDILRFHATQTVKSK